PVIAAARPASLPVPVVTPSVLRSPRRNGPGRSPRPPTLCDRRMDELTVRRSASHGRPAVIGLDVGTSSVKGLLAGPSRALASARRGYRLDIGPGGRVELDAEAVWRAARSVIRQLAASAGTLGHDVVGVCC